MIFRVSGKFTGLPFVFATWTARVQPDDNFVAEFNNAISIGMKMIPEIAKARVTILFQKRWSTLFNEVN